MWKRTRTLGLCLIAAWATACVSPTVTIATQKPIEIKIDLHHEVRIQLDRELSDMVDSEASRAMAPRGSETDADRIREAKASRRIGERSNGYLGTPTTEPAEADQALLERVNASRRSDYLALAEQKQLPLAEIEKLAGANRIQAADAGEAIETPEGVWIDKTNQTIVVVTDERDA